MDLIKRCVKLTSFGEASVSCRASAEDDAGEGVLKLLEYQSKVTYRELAHNCLQCSLIRLAIEQALADRSLNIDEPLAATDP